MKKPFVFFIVVLLFCVGIVNLNAQIVHVSAERQIETRNSSQVSLLMRELARQALLICLEDRFGYTTIDDALEEQVPADFSGATGLIEVRETSSGKIMVRLSGPEIPTEDWYITLTKSPNVFPYINRFADVALLLMKDVFPEWLMEQGLEPRQRFTETPNSSALEAVEESLYVMNVFAQLRALATLEIIPEELLSYKDLLYFRSIIYANLGVLTRYFWYGAGPVYTARSLLYAKHYEALYSHDNPQRSNLVNGYVKVMAGLENKGMENLEAAHQEDGLLPDWAQIVLEYAQFHPETLLKGVSENPNLRSLELYLRFLLYRRSNDSGSILRSGWSTLQENALTMAVWAEMSRVAGVKSSHQLTTDAQRFLISALYNYFPLLQDMTPSHKDLAVDVFQSADIPMALERLSGFADSLQEGSYHMGYTGPSSSELGRIIQEMMFIQTYDRLFFMKMKWVVDLSDYREAALKYTAGHPYANIIRAYFVNEENEINNLLNSIELRDLSLGFLAFATRNPWAKLGLPGNWVTTAFLRAFDAGAAVSFDIADHFAYLRDESKPKFASELYELDDHAPEAIALLFELGDEEIQATIDSYIQEYPTSVLLQNVTANHFRELGLEDSYEEVLLNLISETKELQYYEDLADLFLNQDQGDLTRWLSVYQRFLDQGVSYGLEFPSARSSIARKLFSYRRFDEALIYAEAGAESWAAWAMGTAFICNLVEGNLTEAEAWIRHISERYQNSDWYLWSILLGLDSIEEARAQRDDPENRIHNRNRDEQMGIAQYLQGDSNAVADLMALGQSNNNFNLWLFGALRLLIQGQGEEALSELRAMSARMNQDGRDSSELVDTLVNYFTRSLDHDKEFDDVYLQELMNKAETEEEILSVGLYAGLWCIAHEQVEGALVYFTRVLLVAEPWANEYMLTFKEVQLLGIDPIVLIRGQDLVDR